MSKSIIDRPIYTIVNYIYAFLTTNFYFLLANSLFIIVFFLADFTIQNILLYYVALLPFGPAIAALFGVMGKLVRDKVTQPTKDYWYYYRKNFKIAMKYWLIQATIFLILIIDIYYAQLFISFLAPLFFIFLIVSGFIMLYAFPILTKFEVKLKNLFFVSFYANFHYFKKTLLNLTTVAAFGVIFYVLPGVATLFITSVTCFFIMFNLQTTFGQMEQQLSYNDNQLARDNHEQIN
ncbi:hypothetical protein Pryu01_02288 [Paraliobacillus ryukyuensis]|uniref:Putative membrane protein YesL n=1 Tax=Paraliobacillus ryukyuensis TaxID=200904 RepID=A0A366EEF0_9BACI|nr:DUF624 domain-containing protein [Paraliobacillus ryukyuensis]RBP00777.1 putative membrane protein YesL [Paraliobacillus ryukyuensis]